MKEIFIFAFSAILLTSCTSKNSQKESGTILTDTIASNENHNATKNTSVYEGTLPCADCEGIKTILKINIIDNKFESTSIYIGKSPEKKFIEEGNINTERGLEKDPDGTIFILNWDKPEKDQIYYGYYSKNPEKLYLLDRTKKVIKSKLNYYLELNE